MKFDHIDQSIQYGKVKRAKYIYNRLALELGVREDNYHVGTGMGGNNVQLFTLLNIQNELVNDHDITIEVKDDKVLWGSRWFTNAKFIDIRHELNIKFPLIKEKHKYPAIAIEVITFYPDAMREGFLKNKKHYPKLAEALAGKPFSFDPNLTSWEMMMAACVLCAELASDLDKNIHKRITPIALALDNFPMEVNLVAIRRFIQIDRLVKHNLDEHSDFSKILTTINKTVDR
jgi:hypothetical protein